MARKKHNVSRLRKRQIAELKQQDGWTRIKEFETKYKLSPFEFYKNEAGQLLVIISEDIGQLWVSAEEFFQLRERILEQHSKPPYHILQDRLLYGEEFPAYIPQLISEIAVITKVPAEVLDFSDASLDLLTKKIRRLGGEKCLQPALFSGLVAYLTEAMRYRLDGTIRMMRSNIRTIVSNTPPVFWEPWVFDTEGRSCQCWLELYKMFVENEYGYDLKLIDMEINLRKVRKFPD